MNDSYFAIYSVLVIIILYFRLKLTVGFVKKGIAYFELGWILTSYLFGTVILTDIYPINTLTKLFSLLIGYYAITATLYLIKRKIVKVK